MKEVFSLSNASGSANQACIAATLDPDMQWQCNFAEHALAYTETPTFAINSALDSWQVGSILYGKPVANFPNQTGYENGRAGASCCYRSPPGCSRCDAEETSIFNAYIDAFQDTMSSTMSRNSDHSNGVVGSFAHSCYTHCEGQGAAFNEIKVAGVTMAEALANWWETPTTALSTAPTSYTACRYNALPASGASRACNPTCPASA